MLKSNTVPFLYPVHRDPQDLIRLGPDGLEQLLADFTDVKIYSMGNFFGVLALMLERKISSVQSGSLLRIIGVPKITKILLLVTAKFLTKLDRNPVALKPSSQLVTFSLGSSDNYSAHAL